MKEVGIGKAAQFAPHEEDKEVGIAAAQFAPHEEDKEVGIGTAAQFAPHEEDKVSEHSKPVGPHRPVRSRERTDLSEMLGIWRGGTRFTPWTMPTTSCD